MPDRVVQGVTKCVPDQLVSPGTGVVLSAGTAGIVRLLMQDGSSFDVYAVVGTTELNNYAVRGYSTTGTTATGVVVSVF